MDSRHNRLAAHVLGERGEHAVAEWYRRAGYTIVDRNWRCREGEIDIVAERDGTVVFCEVKSRAHARYADPAASVGRAKQRRVRTAAFRWLDGRGWFDRLRFDVATVISGRVTVIEDAF